jgi:hypothetical protein
VILVNLEISEPDLKKILSQYLTRLNGVEIAPNCISIEVKSKQNYKSEWESADFRARVVRFVDPMTEPA